MSEHDMNKEKIIDTIKSQFIKGVWQKVSYVVEKEIDLMLSGFILAMEGFVRETKEAALDSASSLGNHGARIMDAYDYSRAKHPYFADNVGWFNPDGKNDSSNEADILAANKWLSYKRRLLKSQTEKNKIRGTTVLECEIAEIEEALAQKDKAHAAEECYDAIAVLMRMVDVLEGRQALGDPEKEDADKEGDEE